jgi:hypothetical protein
LHTPTVGFHTPINLIGVILLHRGKIKNKINHFKNWAGTADKREENNALNAAQKNAERPLTHQSNDDLH